MEVATSFNNGGMMGSNGGGGGGGGGGEFRRLHIVYFLTRMGRIEHPHLIRVRHLNRNGGVFLRDVKRWMGELRGKDLPDSFSWSYKRRYKTGYIWQDLIDDDLITPISDNEYVLKGSEITTDDEIPVAVPLKETATSSPSSSSSSSTTFEMVPGSTVQSNVVSKDQEQGNHHHLEPFSVGTKHYSNQSYSSTGSSTSSSSPIVDRPLTTSPIVVDKTTVIGSGGDVRDSRTISPYYTYTFDHRNKCQEYSSPSPTTGRCSQSPAMKSRRSWRQRYYSNAASSRVMLRRLMVCGGAPADTAVVDAVMVAVNKSTSTVQGNGTVNTQSTSAAKNRALVGTAHELQLKLHRDQSARRRKEESEGSNRKGSSQSGLFCRKTDVSEAYRPVGAPTCTQCGKSFRPEKLHMHMSRSCRGMRKDSTASPDEEMASPTSPCKPFVKKQLITATTA